MRAQKLIVGAVLGSMLLGVTGSIVARQKVAYPPGQTIEAQLADLKSSLARAVSAGEEDLSGIAKSVRFDLSQGEPRWIVGVDADGSLHDVVVDPDGTVISKTAQAVPIIQPDAQSGTSAKVGPVPSRGSPDALNSAPPIIAPVEPEQRNAS